jgi:signal transduction histidine kinase
VIGDALNRIAVPVNIDVVRQSDEALPPITTDPDQLTQVFGNIILNAIQAMPEGGRLTITSHKPSPMWLTISFVDTGVGISKKNMDNIFEPFFTTKAKGIGFGLVISRAVVENQGGTIEVQSEVGKGSSFTVKLPIRSRPSSKRSFSNGTEPRSRRKHS